MKTRASKDPAKKPKPPTPAPPAKAQAEPKVGPSTFEIIDKLYSAGAEGVSPPAGTVFHWWGQFSDELPAPFHLPRGGHGWLEARDLDHTAQVLEKLRDHVLAMVTPSDPEMKLERTHEWAGDSWFRWMLADGRQMTLEFKRRSKLTPAQKRDLKSL